jgi:serine/threonine protein kinase
LDRPAAPSYRAPERFAAQPHHAVPGVPALGLAADRASDLYACGVTLYQLLTGKFPYGVVDAFHGPRLGAPTPPSQHRRGTPKWLERVLLKACARDPRERYQSADQFLRALEQDAGAALQLPLPRLGSPVAPPGSPLARPGSPLSPPGRGAGVRGVSRGARPELAQRGQATTLKTLALASLALGLALRALRRRR